MKRLALWLAVCAAMIAAVMRLDWRKGAKVEPKRNWMIWATVTDLTEVEADLLHAELSSILNFDYPGQNYVLKVEDTDGY